MKYEKTNQIDECSICLEEYENGQRVYITKCYHKYHIECLSYWYKKNKNCPLCREHICIDSIIQTTVSNKRKNKSICLFLCFAREKSR